MFETNIAPVEVGEVLFSTWTMYSIGGAVKTTVVWRCLLHAFVDKMTLNVVS